jgi:pantothenate kinase type III
MENILLSSASPEYDEELLLNIIGTSSIKEIQLLDLKYQEVKGKSLYSLFESKTKEGSQLRKLLTEIFKYERDESKDKNLIVFLSLLKNKKIIVKNKIKKIINNDIKNIIIKF